MFCASFGVGEKPQSNQALALKTRKKAGFSHLSCKNFRQPPAGVFWGPAGRRLVAVP
jgi:hypothetical protein